MTALFSLPSGFHAAVIGGAGDIGAAISNLFCDLGATVTATAVDDAAISSSQLRSRAGLTIRPLDVTNDAAVDAFAKGHERVDALIRCALRVAERQIADIRRAAKQGKALLQLEAQVAVLARQIG